MEVEANTNNDVQHCEGLHCTVCAEDIQERTRYRYLTEESQDDRPHGRQTIQETGN